MDCTSSVQTLINQFELMAQANVTPTAPRSWSVAGSKHMELPPQPKSHISPEKEIIARMNTQRVRSQSEPAQKAEETLDAADPTEEAPVPVTPTKPAAYPYKSLTVNTLESDDEDYTMTKFSCYSAIPPSPSSYSTTSTGSLDSLLSSLDLFLPDLLQAAGETSAEASQIVKPTAYRSEKLQSTKTSKLVPPSSYRRATLTGKSLSTTDKVSSAPKPRRSSLYAPKNPPPVKSTRHFSESARGAPVVSSPCARGRSVSTSAPRYMDYDSSPRFAATKARNLERRRQLEERNRNLTADKTQNVVNKTRKPEWQGSLDQVRLCLFDPKEDNQSHAAKAKTTTSRRHSTYSRRV